MIRTVKFWITLCLIAFSINTASASGFFFTPGTGEFGIGKEISVDLKIDTEGVGVNAGQATIRFPKDILEVKSVDKTDSAFGFWLEEPSFSNTDGAITFVGGTPYGVSGSSVQVLHIVFTTKSSGVGTISFVDSAITSSDGTGTNVLSKTTEAAFTVSPENVAAIVTPPTQIKREPVAPTGLPIKPVVSVPLYPDMSNWYSHSNVFSASWNLPGDISDVTAVLNKQPTFSPSSSEGLFDNKMFGAISDGVWYLHVRFQNDIGWGPVNHYRISVDTKAPLPFDITTSESEASDNPTPVFNFKTNDALSGVREYSIRIDTNNWISVPVKMFTGSFKLPNQTPGKHVLTVQAIDLAGNSIENTFNYETLPLESPTFTFATDKLFSDESMGLSFKGTSLPSTKVLLTLKKGPAIIANETINVNTDGNWEHTFSNALRNGTYTASIQTIDSRGALSLVVEAPKIKVTGRYSRLITITILVLLSALALGYIFYKTRRSRTSLRIQVAERDTANAFNMIKTDIQKLQDAQKTSTSADDEFLTDKLKKNVEKLGSYVKDEIGRAKE